jgi:hypothetical protein
MSIIAVDFLLGPDFLSRTVAWFGKGKSGYSHCASLLEDGRYVDARSDRLGGVEPGIQYRKPATEQWVRLRRATLEVPELQYAEWEDNLKAKIGDLYAMRDIVGFVTGHMLHRPATYECAALAINALQHIHLVPFPLPFPAHQLTPNDALLIVATAGFKVSDVLLFKPLKTKKQGFAP